MADEPILCFDGDDAGRRAAYRAVDLALPLIKPGKSLRFAALPDGQDPDELARSGGRDAIEDVLSAARPLADVLWTRESEAGPVGWIRRSVARRLKRAWVKSPQRSATRACAATTSRTLPRGCAGCSRRQPTRAKSQVRLAGGSPTGSPARLGSVQGARPRAAGPAAHFRSAWRADAKSFMSPPARSSRRARFIAAIVPQSRVAKR